MRLTWKTCLRAGVTVVVVWLVITYWPSLTDFIGQALGAGMPLLLGAGIGYVANILMRFYERCYFPKARKKGLIRSRRPVCLLMAYVTVLAMIYFVFSAVVPELWRCITMLLEKLPDALRSGYDWLEENYGVDELLSAMGLGSFDNFDWKSYINRAVTLVFTGVGGVMGAAFTVVSSTVSFIVTLVLGLAFSAYLLAGKESIGQTIHRLIRVYGGEKLEKKVFYVLNTFDDSFHHFIVSQCLEAVILGSLCILGMMIFQFPYAIMIGTLVGFTAFIPIAGAYFAGAVGAFMIFTVDPLKAVLFVIFLVCLQQAENNLIYPRVVGSSINMPPIWVLAAITIGGGMLGVFGMLLGVPTAAAIFRLVDSDMKAREQGKSVFSIAEETSASPEANQKDDKTIGA